MNKSPTECLRGGQWNSLPSSYTWTISFFSPVFKLAEDALPSQFTCEDPAASVPSSSNYIYVPFIILWALTVAAAEGLSAART